jgi:hypothetical protein
LGIFAYGWYSVLVSAIVYCINRRIEDEVVIPFNSLKENIWSLIIDPMIVISQSQFSKIAGIYSMIRNKKQEGLGRGMQRKGHIKKQNVENLTKTFDNEIEQIDQSLFKISKLLMLCYGEAGATVVSRMINNESAILDFAKERGNKVMAIFAYCDIRNFCDATEVF